MDGKSPIVVIRNVAVSDRAGTAEFAEEADCGEGSSLGEASSSGTATRRLVQVVTLDAEFTDPEVQIDLLKIDTEGYDLKVLYGAANILAKTRFLQFEYNTHWIVTGSSLFEATRYLGRHGFSVFLVRSTGLHPLRYQLWGDYYRYSNFFACREADKTFVGPLLGDPI